MLITVLLIVAALCNFLAAFVLYSKLNIGFAFTVNILAGLACIILALLRGY